MRRGRPSCSSPTVAAGKIGEKEAAPDRKARAAINTIDRVATRSMALEVKGPDDASDLQGALASDEDGAPAIVETRDGLFVAGIAIGRERASVGLVRTGDRDTYARVSAYAGWVGSVMLGVGAKEAAELLGDGIAARSSREPARGSQRMSSMLSRPIERRTISGGTPARASSSSFSCRCVVEAGWITSDFASPMLAKWLTKVSASMNFTPASKPPLMPKARSAPAPRGM